MVLTEMRSTQAVSAEKTGGFSDRILMLLAQQKRTKSWLADEIGISKQALNYILTHASKKKCVNEIALALGVDPAWLVSGQGRMTVSLEHRSDVRSIPLLSMQLVSSSEDIPVSASYDPHCFAVRLDNDSMEPLFTEGSILIFDPAKQPKNKDFVLFSLPESVEIYFRQLFKEGEDYYFKSMDKMYKPLVGNKMHFYGVLVESRHCFK